MKRQTFESVGLACGIAIPIVYFGIQLIAAPFYLEYSFYSNDASTLGSPESSFPAIFNVGCLLLCLLWLFASYGFAEALFRSSVSRWLSYPIVFAFIAAALASLNAGLFPLPHEQHTNGILARLGMAKLLIPVLLPFAFRAIKIGKALSIYLWVNLAILLAMIPVVSGLLQRIFVANEIEFDWYQNFLNTGHGVLQRIAAAAVLIPIGVLCFHILRTQNQKMEVMNASVSKPADG